jgi:hypothetical protein
MSNSFTGILVTRGSISCWTYTLPLCFPRPKVSCPKASLATIPRHPPNARSSKLVTPFPFSFETLAHLSAHERPRFSFHCRRLFRSASMRPWFQMAAATKGLSLSWFSEHYSATCCLLYYCFPKPCSQRRSSHLNCKRWIPRLKHQLVNDYCGSCCLTSLSMLTAKSYKYSCQTPGLYGTKLCAERHESQQSSVLRNYAS